MTHMTFDTSKVSSETRDEILDAITWVKLNYSRSTKEISLIINSLFGLFDGYYYSNLSQVDLNEVDEKLKEKISPIILKLNNEVRSFRFSISDNA